MVDRSRLAGVELYFDDLQLAKSFYGDTLGLVLDEDDPTHHAKFALGSLFLCLERKGGENYPSADKAVVFLEVADLRTTLNRLDSKHVVGSDFSTPQPWAAVRDPEGHTVMLIQRR